MQGCEIVNCPYWNGKVCTDPNDYKNIDGFYVCGRRDDAIPVIDSCPLDMTRPENYPCSRGDCDCEVCKDTQGKEE